jgi:hypothetical protein
MFFFRPSARRRHGKSSHPRARLQVEALELRAVPSTLADGSGFTDEFVVDSSAQGDQYYFSVALDGSGETVVLSGGIGPGDSDVVFAELSLDESAEMTFEYSDPFRL